MSKATKIIVGGVSYLASAFTGVLASDWYGQAARGSTDQADMGNMAVAASVVFFVVGTVLLALAFRRTRADAGPSATSA